MDQGPEDGVATTGEKEQQWSEGIGVDGSGDGSARVGQEEMQRQGMGEELERRLYQEWNDVVRGSESASGNRHDSMIGAVKEEVP